MAIGASLIVLFAILGAGALVVTGAGVARFFGADDAADGFPAVRGDQMAYMRRVRMRNLAWAEREAGRRSQLQG
ncbi:hypothetical protein HO133_005327 [Letharia lupina]|uniref:Uncharacterized protein n=1 Tax=Letharia lupina TaxID=560253 RepID=A0A8H6C8V4_9LECA|nr:uncharacterized protein HO133_005327 [Letharia lupina]KAF6218784.1 hypothetical protein HO133_005327 [Letharia lupina]